MKLKKRIREKILIQRGIHEEYDCLIYNEKIISNVKSVLNAILKNNYKKLVIGLYWPVSGEPDLIKLVVDSNNSFALPKIYSTKIDFVSYKIGTPLERSYIKSIMQPKNNIKQEPNVVIVPGLAYSLNGYRLGFGNGSYDKFFDENNTKKFIKIGVCFHEYLYEYLPYESHDIKMDYIITNQTIISL